MRSQITRLVAATTSAVILAFVIPLCLLVRTLAEDRAGAATSQAAQSVAILVSSVTDRDQLTAALTLVNEGGVSGTTVLLPTGEVLGAADPASGLDPLVQRAQATRAAFTERDGTGLTVLIPVVIAGGTAIVRSHVNSTDLHDGVMSAWLSILGLGAVLLATSIVVARELGRRISTPVTEVAAVAHQLRAGDFEARAEPGGTDEVVELATALNQLADRIAELLLAEREVVADLSHRLRTPVTALRLDSELVPDGEVAARLRGHVDHLQRTVDAVVREARRPVRTSMHGSCDAAAIVRDRVNFWRPLAEDQERLLHLVLPPGPILVPVAAEDMRDLVDNVIDNVFAHTPEGCGFDVDLARDARGVTRLTIADTGPGIPDGSSATERGDSGSGSTGLGLDIVRRIARSAGGQVSLGRSAGGGLAVTVVFAPVG